MFLLFLSQMMKRKIAQKLESDESKDYYGDCWPCSKNMDERIDSHWQNGLAEGKDNSVHHIFSSGFCCCKLCTIRGIMRVLAEGTLNCFLVD